MNCKKAGTFMMKHMDGELGAEDYNKLQEHLAACATCAEDFSSYSEILTEFEDTTCLLVAPNGLEQAVMTKIECLEPQESHRKNGAVIVALIIGALSVLLGALVLFFCTQRIENILLELPHAIDSAVSLVARNGYLLFLVASALIVSQAIIRCFITVKRKKHTNS